MKLSSLVFTIASIGAVAGLQTTRQHQDKPKPVIHVTPIPNAGLTGGKVIPIPLAKPAHSIETDFSNELNTSL